MDVSIELEYGDLVLHLFDKNQDVAIHMGVSDTYAEAGAERLAALACHFAELVKIRAGSRTAPKFDHVEIGWWRSGHVHHSWPATTS